MSQGGTDVRRSVHLALNHRKMRKDKAKPKLPIVQVNPFLREREHTWCKDTSLPEFYEKPDIMYNCTEALVKPPPTAFSTHSESQLTSRENRPILPLAQLNKPNNEANDVSVPVSSPVKVKLFDLPPPPATTSGAESHRARKIVFPQTPRNGCITPDKPIKLLPKHGFSPTIVDREKKTVKESTNTKPTSLLNREKTQEFVSKQQLLRLRGMRLVHGHLAPAPSIFLSRHDSIPAKGLEEFYRHLVTSYNRGYAFSPTKARMTAASYPSVSQTRKLESSDPLVSLNNENLSVRLNSSVDMTDEKSAFRILESAGKQTHIEQNLVHDYKQYYDMNKLGNSPAVGHHFTRFLKLKNYNPTQGELLIMVNKEQNRSSPANWLKTHLLTSRDVEYGTESYSLKPEQRDSQVNKAAGAENTNALRPITGDSTSQRVPSAQSIQGEGINLKSKSQAEEEEVDESTGRQTRIEITTTLPDINNNSAA